MSDEEQLGIYNDVNEFEEFSKEGSHLVPSY